MRVSYRKRNETIWKEIPNVIMPISISDVADDSFDNVKLSFLVAGNDSDYDELRYMKPKTYIRITSTDDDNDINERNTYYFITTKMPKARIRKEIKDEDDVVITNNLWQIELTGMELIKELEDTNMPNYTITQPKTQFFNRYRKLIEETFLTNQYITQNYSGATTFTSSNKITNEKHNIDNVSPEITSALNLGGYEITINSIAQESYSIDFAAEISKTSGTQYKFLLLEHDINNAKYVNGEYKGVSSLTCNTFKVIKTYYDASNNILSSNEEIIQIDYDGGLVDYENGKITSLGKINIINFNVNVSKLDTASKAKVRIEHHLVSPLYNYSVRQGIDYSIIENILPTEISGFPNDTYVKSIIHNISYVATSNQLSDEIIEPKQTLLDLVDKALFDYNFNRRNKLTLGEDTRVLLDVFANESEWNGYNFRELLVRAFKYVGAIPYLTIDRVITAIKPKVFDTMLVIDDLEDDDENINDEDYFDTIVSSAKNLVSDTDFATETVFIGGGTDEFSQITDTNAAFTFNNAIYYISKAVLYAPNVSFTIPLAGGGTSAVNSNMDQANYWDITERVLDNNLYKALPNVNFSSIAGRTSSELGQGNTISFTSGSRKIDNIINRAPDVPSYNPISQNQQLSEYSIIELLICLAYEYLMGQYSYDETDFASYSYNGQLDDIIQMELTLTFVPYHKEITTKFISNKTDRIGLHYQKKVNISDRTIDYKENQLVLTNEMNRKGNIQKFVPVKYKSLEEVIPVGSIINNGKYVVTSKRLVLHNEMVECEYTLDSDMLNQNTDIGLSVEYEAYNVPYEYVLREVFIDNHLIFSKEATNEFSSDESGCNISLLEDVFIKDTANDKTLDKEIYARFAISYESETAKTMFMSLKRLTSRFSMILNGNLVDNYSAGNQRYSVNSGGEDNEDLWYSQPYRYTDYRGRFAAIYSMLIGYTPNAKYHISNYYDLNLFPYTDGYSFGRWLYINNNFHVMKKDSREAISLNYHTYLETIDENIKFYEFLPINSYGELNPNVDTELTDNMQLGDVSYRYFDGASFPITFEITSASYTNVYKARITILEQDYDIKEMDFTNGMILMNTNGKEITMVGVIKNPTITTIYENGYKQEISFYIATTRYGKK